MDWILDPARIFDYGFASISIGFLIGAIVAMLLLFNWIKGV